MLLILLRRNKQPLQWIIALIALAFLLRVLADSWAEVQRHAFSLEPIPLSIASILLVMVLFVAVLPWQWSVQALGAPLSFGAASRLWFLSNAVRYVPGNIWQPVTMIALGRAYGLDEVRTAASVALNWILSNGSALLIGGLYWGLNNRETSLERWWLAPLALASVVIMLQPAVLGRALRLALKATRRTDDNITWTFATLASLFLAHCAIWIGYGLAFALFWRALYTLDWSDVPRLTGAFAAAYAIGFLSLLTPSGLGVREGALVFFLSSAYPAGIVTLIALLSRVWLIGGELLCTALVLALTRGRDE